MFSAGVLRFSRGGVPAGPRVPSGSATPHLTPPQCMESEGTTQQAVLVFSVTLSVNQSVTRGYGWDHYVLWVQLGAQMSLDLAAPDHGGSR